MTVKYLELKNKEELIAKFLPMAQEDTDHMIVSLYDTAENRERSLELKEMFGLPGNVSMAWFNKMKNGDSMQVHQDSKDTQTYVFYLLSDDNCPIIIDGTEYITKRGDCITYNSFLPHEVPKITGNRISIIMEIKK